MPRITLWNPNKSNDYNFMDKNISEYMNAGGVGVIVHRYVGPTEDGEITDIQDVLFLENRERYYDKTLLEMRCDYTPNDTEFNLSQFGIFLSSNVMRFDFHYNNLMTLLGRKLMAGDVLEFPNMRDIDLYGNALNKYFVVKDSVFAADGYGPTWRPHMLKVNATVLTGSEEFNDILLSAQTDETMGGLGANMGIVDIGTGGILDTLMKSGITYEGRLCKTLDSYCRLIGITDQVLEEAEQNVFYDPRFMATPNIYIYLDENGYPRIRFWRSGDGIPPNGAKLKGIGEAFPDDMKDGEYFLRTDYMPDRLFQKQGSRFVRIEDDLRRFWTAYQTNLDPFIDNDDTFINGDGEEVVSKQALADILKPKVDVYKEDKITKKQQRAEKKLNHDKNQGFTNE